MIRFDHDRVSWNAPADDPRVVSALMPKTHVKADRHVRIGDDPIWAIRLRRRAATPSGLKAFGFSCLHRIAIAFKLPASLRSQDARSCPSPDTGARKSGTYNEGYHAGLTTGLIFGVWLGALAACLFALCWSFVQ